MESTNAFPVPSGHTPEGGVLVGRGEARHLAVLYEDPQCPYCRRFEELSGDLVRRETAAGAVAVEYRMRCFLGPESVRAGNALALAGEVGRFDELRRTLFENQPPEGTGGFTQEDLIGLGRLAGMTGADYVAGVASARYEPWAAALEQIYQLEDPDGTPFAVIDGEPLEPQVLYDPMALGVILRR